MRASPPVDADSERVPLLSLEELHDLLRLLHRVAEGGGDVADEAGRLARGIAARVPSQN